VRNGELIKVLKDDELVWSSDFESIRKPLAKLLEVIEQTGSHQFDEQVDALVAGLLDY
jgi:ribulose 1,5-bisphosphate carboxylase large subunit-like protein